MSNPWCNDGKSPQNPRNSNTVFENSPDLLLGWFKNLNAQHKQELIIELSTKVQGLSMEKQLPTERAEEDDDLKTRHFQQLLQRLSSKKHTVGSKILKAYLGVQRRYIIEHEDQHLLKSDKLSNLKSIDSRAGSPVVRKEGAISEVGSSLNPELFKIKNFSIRRPQSEQGGATHESRTN
ncbi:hypothetical protein E1A91_A05G088700v1 [Gossypium mustelinum]|uniref:Uncharacterized protein n=1 Tax=Gossypium mustelinum TaxID=34275 RepID=A0A5D2Z4U3_GOSMU|nr:hypothetical protein E1A91_A05G088700v1 [Gossypium mustelinum]